jgi:hydrogenase maturation factor
VSSNGEPRACITCGDVAVEARVVAVRSPSSAVVEIGGKREEVATELVDPVATGDLLLCHAGIALEKLPARSRGAAA